MSKWPYILAIACSFLCSCKKRQQLSRANVEVVERHFARAQELSRRGPRDATVSPKEVESVLGPPHRIDPPETARRDVEVFRYYYHQGTDTYELHFFDNRLIQMAKLPSSAPAPAEAKP